MVLTDVDWGLFDSDWWVIRKLDGTKEYGLYLGRDDVNEAFSEKVPVGERGAWVKHSITRDEWSFYQHFAHYVDGDK